MKEVGDKRWVNYSQLEEASQSDVQATSKVSERNELNFASNVTV